MTPSTPLKEEKEGERDLENVVVRDNNGKLLSCGCCNIEVVTQEPSILLKKRGIYRGGVSGEFGEANNPGFRDSFRPPLLGISL